MGIHIHLTFKALRHGLLGQVVVGRAKTAAGDHQIRSLKGNAQRVLQSGGIISHYRMVKDTDAQGSQLLRQKGGVGVDDITQQKLGAYA